MPRFQFSLRTLLIAVTLLAIPCGYVGWQFRIVEHRRALLKEVVSKGGIYGGVTADNMLVSRGGHGVEIKGDAVNSEAYDLSWIRRLLGDFYVRLIRYIPKSDETPFIEELREAFPEAKIATS